MRSTEILMLAAFLLQPDTMTDSMKMTPLTISVECEGNTRCEFNGEDIHLRIRVTNTSSANIGVPLEYLKKKGPHVQLTDVRSGKNRWLRVGLAPRALQEKFVTIAPNEVIEISTTLTANEIRTFRNDFVDLDVEVAIVAKLKPENRDQLEFSESKTFNIAGRDTEELRKANR
jgi:hypothetical protein